MRRVVGGASLVLAVSATAWASAWGSASIRATSTETRLLIPARPDDRTIAHVLNRIGFGPTPGDIARVRAIGLDAYIDQQLHPERIADSGLASRLSELPTLAKNTGELTQEYFLPAQMARQRQQRAVAGQAMPAGTDPGAAAMPDTAPSTAIGRERIVLLELSQQKILRATYSERQLEEVMVDFWFNHFNVFAAKGLTRVYLSEYERDAIRPHVLGRFRGLLQATAESPAMLFYLDNWQSAAPSSAAMSGGRREGRGEPPLPIASGR